MKLSPSSTCSFQVHLPPPNTMPSSTPCLESEYLVRLKVIREWTLKMLFLLWCVCGTIGRQWANQVLAMYPSNLVDDRSTLSRLGTDMFFICPTRYAAAQISNFLTDIFFYMFMHSPIRDFWNDSPYCRNGELVLLCGQISQQALTSLFLRSSCGSRLPRS